MDTELPAGGFLRHKGLILAAAGGAVVEGGLLTLFAPNARSLSPQVTAVPSLAAYHDLRWLFDDPGSWFWFAGLVAVVLVARAALDAALLRLAWPAGRRPPSLGRSFVSMAALTLLAWLMLTPAATLTFGAAVVPFSWPFLGAFPIMLGIVAALAHGGVLTAWWRRVPPLRALLWLLASFGAATAAAAVITHLDTAAALAVTAAAGLVNARCWYGLACLAARVQPRAHVSVPARVVYSLPFAPLGALLVIVLVVGTARLLFTGAIQLPIDQAQTTIAAAAVGGSGGSGSSPAGPAAADPLPAAGAVLVVGGWGSSCCDAGNNLKAALPGVTVRQFSYTGLDAHGQPIPSGADADDLPLPVLGDKIAAQVRALHTASHQPVAVVAESEGTLGVYAMLARDRDLPVSSVTLLSPIVSPGQVAFADGTSVSTDALDELNHLVGNISPYGPSGAQRLLSSVSSVGARYFGDMIAAASSKQAGADGQPVRWLAVVPLADAVTLPYCGLPPSVIVVPAFHGGLLGDPGVFPMVTSFLSGHDVSNTDTVLREAADLITGASAAWRMPDTSAACPFPAG